MSLANWSDFHRLRRQRRKPIVVAHRGVPVLAPENTLGSFSLALDQGADVLETDLWFSRDGEIVLFHDATLDRMTDGHGPVSQHTLAQIKRLRTRTPTGGLSTETVPSLIELLASTQAGIPLLLELKDPLFSQPARAARLVETLAAYRAIESCAIISFHPEFVRSVQAVCPQIPVGHITLSNPVPRPHTALLGPYWPLLFANPLYAVIARWMGSVVAPLDPTPERRMAYYLRLRVDAILADYPSRAIQAMGGKEPSDRPPRPDN